MRSGDRGRQQALVDFNNLGSALEQFHTKHGVYPPSRIYLLEDCKLLVGSR